MTPPPLAGDSEELHRVAVIARDMVVCIGYTEIAIVDEDAVTYKAAVCLTGDGVLGRHRKVHQPLGQWQTSAAGDRFDAFDTPVEDGDADRLRQDLP